jgi:hypothetical protein
VKFFKVGKDGGPESTVTGYWLFEIKWLGSVVLLKFEDGSRDRYHSHAFNSLNWVLKGGVEEQVIHDPESKLHRPSIIPIVTRRSQFHRVVSRGTTWVFSIRGPWSKSWKEWDPKTDRTVTLTYGRVEV